jgi:hypothetical protein
VALIIWATLPTVGRTAPFKEAEVTRTVNIVSLFSEIQAARAAAIGDVISGRTALKTADESRAELRFPDTTITRVGSNAIFRFFSGGREMTLDGGTMLFSSPSGAGGGQVQAGAITAAVTGTDFLVSYSKGPAEKGGRVRVICLSHTVLVYFTANPAERIVLRSGQMVEVPNGSTRFLPAAGVSLSLLLSTNELFEAGGFGPLPSQAILREFANNQKEETLKALDPAAHDQEGLRSALGVLGSRGLEPAVVAEAVGQVANDPALVGILVTQVARVLSSEGQLLSIVSETVKKFPDLATTIAGGSAAGAPTLAPSIAAQVAALFPKLAVPISYAVTKAVPGDAQAIAQAVAEVVPDQRDLVFALAILGSRGLDPATVAEAVDQVAKDPVKVEILFTQVARVLPNEEALMTILLGSVNKFPALASAIAAGAAAGAPTLAPSIAAQVAALFPKLAVPISYAVTQAVPADAREIAEAVAGVVPDQRDIIFAAVGSVPEVRLDLAKLGFSIGQGMNPANFSSGATQSGQAPGGPSTNQSQTSSSNGQPPIQVISPEN